MVVKGLLDHYQLFIAVTTQSKVVVQDFQKFKIALKNFEDTEQARNHRPSDTSDGENVMKTNFHHTNYNKKFTCFNCGTVGDKPSQCNKPKKPKDKDSKPYCSYHKTNSHSNKACRKQKQNTANNVTNEPVRQSFILKSTMTANCL